MPEAIGLFDDGTQRVIRNTPLTLPVTAAAVLGAATAEDEGSVSVSSLGVVLTVVDGFWQRAVAVNTDGQGIGQFQGSSAPGVAATGDIWISPGGGGGGGGGASLEPTLTPVNVAAFDADPAPYVTDDADWTSSSGWFSSDGRWQKVVGTWTPEISGDVDFWIPAPPTGLRFYEIYIVKSSEYVADDYVGAGDNVGYGSPVFEDPPRGGSVFVRKAFEDNWGSTTLAEAGVEYTLVLLGYTTGNVMGAEGLEIPLVHLWRGLSALGGVNIAVPGRAPVADVEGNLRFGTVYDTVVPGDGVHSTTTGYRNRAVGIGSHAQGRDNFATGQYSHAEGYGSETAGSYAHAEGLFAKASGDASHAEGSDTTASATFAHAEGTGTTASSQGAHAEGQNTTASQQAAHAEGFGSTADGEYSHAEGYTTQATGVASHAEGFHARATRYGEHAGTGSLAANASRTSQYARLVLGAETADATPTLLALQSTDSPMTDNCVSAFTGTAAARSNTGVSKAWKFEGAVKATAATFALLGTPTVTALGADGGAAAWTLAIAMNPAGNIEFTATGAAATSIVWTATLHMTESGMP